MDRNQIVRECKPYSMTGVKRLESLHDIVKVVDDKGIAGALVEVGVYLGGSVMCMMYSCESQDREVWLYDTFKGMTEPGVHDFKIGHGKQYSDYLKKYTEKTVEDRCEWCYGPYDEVMKNVGKVGYPNDKVNVVVGDVNETLEKDYPEKISVLRLDVDFYDATKKALEVLYPRIQKGGYLILDDHNRWNGANKAADEYLTDVEYMPVDDSCVVVQK